MADKQIQEWVEKEFQSLLLKAIQDNITNNSEGKLLKLSELIFNAMEIGRKAMEKSMNNIESEIK
jgi:hypothetical protein